MEVAPATVEVAPAKQGPYCAETGRFDLRPTMLSSSFEESNLFDPKTPTHDEVADNQNLMETSISSDGSEGSLEDYRATTPMELITLGDFFVAAA